MAPHEGEVPRVGVPRGVDVDPVRRDHVPPERHRLEEEPALVGQHPPDPGEESAIDLLLPPGAVLLRRAEVLEGAEARHGVERAEAVAGDLPRVVEVDVEAVPPAGRRLSGGQGDADSGAAPTPDEVQERAPPAAQVEHAPARSDPDLLGDVLVLAPLSLLEAQGKVTVVLRSAEVRELSQAEPEDPIDQRIGELEVLAVGHGFEGSGELSDAVRVEARSNACLLSSRGDGVAVVALIGGTHPAPRARAGIGSAPEGRGATVVAASAWRIAEVLRDQPNERSRSSLRSQGRAWWGPLDTDPVSRIPPPRCETPRPPRGWGSPPA